MFLGWNSNSFSWRRKNRHTNGANGSPGVMGRGEWQEPEQMGKQPDARGGRIVVTGCVAMAWKEEFPRGNVARRVRKLLAFLS